MSEARYMERALELANASDGSVAPRPPVGCVIVTPDGETFEGRTKRKPGPHAEAEALAAAGPRAKGATAYVTLEPCTVAVSKPFSCAHLLIEAGVARVVAAMQDPCPDIDGRGFAMLRDAGIDVEVGSCEDEARALIEPFTKWIATREPFVTLKLGASLDGKVAAPDGTSQWITGEQARADVHDLRRRADAVVVGSGTVAADDPALTFRTPGLEGDQPLRVVFDSSGRTSRTAQIFDGAAPSLVVATGEGEWPADVVRVAHAEGGVDIAEALRALGERGICHVLVEAGPTLAGSFVAAGAVDRLVLYLAPKIIGGDAPGLFNAGVKTLVDAWQLRIENVTRIGDDIKIEARL
jgi:diaminohydroxyphosphoribosylaminopyrimidine deaminase/5-amino-6-(5-phosphoribosylamino)uracil reductase